METVAQVLSEYMQQEGVGQEEIAELVGKSQSNVSRWLSGQSIPRPNTLATIADRLGIDHARLIRASAQPTDRQKIDALEREISELRQVLDRVVQRVDAWNEPHPPSDQ